MSSNDTISDSQLSNVSLGLSQDTTNQLLSAVGFNCPSTSDCMMEQYNTEFEEGEEEEGDEGTSSLHVTRAVFTATTLAVSPETSSSQPFIIPASPPQSSTSTSLPITPTNSHASWSSTVAGGNGLSPTLINSPTPPPYSLTTSPLSHLPPPPPLPFPSLPLSGSSLPPQSHPTSICSNVPFNNSVRGNCGFEIALERPHPQVSKTPNSVYSKKTQRMYIKKDADIPLSFTIQSFEGLQRCHLQVTAVHKQPEMFAENLQCCIKHVEEQRRKGTYHPYHFVRSPMEGCGYFGDAHSSDGRLFISLPVSKLQRSGDSTYTAILRFPCFTSDFKRAGQLVQLIFSLYLDRMLLGRAVLDVRVCASPGRDRSVDERRGSEGGKVEEEEEDGQKKKRGRKRSAAQVKEEVNQCTIPPRKVPKVAGKREDLTLNLHTFPEIIPHIMEAVKLLERVYMVPLNIPDDSSTNNELPSLVHQDSFPSLERWLESIGLSRYLSLLKRQGVSDTFQVLGLTDTELKSWGVREADRRVFLDGISQLQEKQTSSSLPPSSQPSLSQTSSVAGTQPFTSFEVVQIQTRSKTLRTPN